MSFWLSGVLAIIVGIVGIFYLFYKKLNRFEKLGILHVKPWPIIGNMAPGVFQRAHFTDVMTKIYNLNANVDYVGFYDFTEPVIMIRSPDLIKNLAVKYFDHFMDHRAFVDPELDPLMGQNLIGLRGEKWKEIRNLLSPAFTGSKMKQMFKLMSDCAQNFAEYFAEKTAEKPEATDMKEAFTRYTNDVIATCAFGISVDSMRNPKNDFYVMGRKSTNFDGIRALKFFLSRSFPRIAKFCNAKFITQDVDDFFMNVVKETIETRDREGITRPDMIQLMMDTRGTNKASSAPEMSIRDMTAQAFIFFFGGFDSSSTLMCFAAQMIAAHPEVAAKLCDEIDAVVKETNDELTYEAINGMQYLDAVINETLRLYPVGPFLDRICTKAFELPPALPGGKPITIEPDQNVWFPAWCLQRDPKYFPYPEQFDPQRFMGSAKHDINAFAYFPFGQGPRMCIGNRFALLEAKVVIFHLFQKCTVKLSTKTCHPLELSKKSFNMVPTGGFWLELGARDTSIIKK